MMLHEKREKNTIQHGCKFPNYHCRILTIEPFGSGKTNALLNLINNQGDLDKFTYLLKVYVKQNINCYSTNTKV